jgi:ATP-dependent exoDNAse (exonuclease V) beta subunit (contains helicase and exonuclease domains)
LEFRKTIDRIRSREDRLSVAEMLETLIAETDLDARLLVRPNGRRRLANVRKLLQMAYQNPSQSIGQFIRRLREVEKLTDREGDAPTEEEASQVVRILTIHKAKGLEFPVVFVGDMARGMAFSERSLFTCDGGTLRLGCRVGEYKDVAYRAIADAKQRAELEESFRVLYVAFTRARERLILCGSTQQGRKRGNNWADIVFPIAGVLGPPERSEESEERIGPGGVAMRVSKM